MGKLSKQKSGSVTPVQCFINPELPAPVIPAMPNQVDESKIAIVDYKSSSLRKRFPTVNNSDNVDESRQNIKDISGSLVSIGIAAAGCGCNGDIYEVIFIFRLFKDISYQLIRLLIIIPF